MSVFLHPKWLETMRLPESALQGLSVRIAERRSDIILRRERGDRLHHRYAPLYLPFERTALDAASRLEETFGSPKLVIVIGIGGSVLATEAVAHALGRGKMLMVFDTLVPERMEELEQRLVEEELERTDIVVVIVSKSGMTLETNANQSAVLTILESKYGDCRDRIIAISNDESPLEESSRENGWKFFAIPKVVEGRYSAMSATTLVPLALLGVDIKKFLGGGEATLKSSWTTPLLKDPASALAAATYAIHEKGIHQEVNFYFSPRLEYLGKWERQLLAETTGKLKGAHRVGILPSVAIGTTDLHSIEQYIMDGPRDLFVVLHALRDRVDDKAPTVYKGKTIAELRSAIIRGLEMSYRQGGVPYMRLDLEDVSEKTLGSYMVIRMEEAILLAHLLGVDPFTQPGVESYKTHTRALLGHEHTE